MFLGVVAALAAAVGTGLQAWQAFVDMAATEDAVLAVAVQDLRDEVPRRRVRLRREQRAIVKQLLEESPTERAAWRRLRRFLYSWGLLCIAALYVLVEQVLAVL
ncbi:hypothetical protein IGS67_11910 [Flavimobilis sp. GY10621]|uniref:Uncharacterized protein n=1 Tax=Flavimobilis rhizosphaerae TaxID=2775421 RepID=A0ABR9DSR9_9MICO|nr:hypothetical protein [Flavimobilis rhizosphaerae]MBD9700185.1 hypothetical protein [Flavimobilis rhizosphaerae]